MVDKKLSFLSELNRSMDKRVDMWSEGWGFNPTQVKKNFHCNSCEKLSLSVGFLSFAGKLSDKVNYLENLAMK
jgi:hypothetical protein